MKKKILPLFLILICCLFGVFTNTLNGQKGECLTDERMQVLQPF